MRSRWQRMAWLCLMACAIAPAVMAKEDVEASREEVIAEVSRVTGLTRDAVGLALSENPRLLDGLDDCVSAIKVVDALANARDSEALADLVEYALGKVKDKLVPAGVGALLTAVSVYQTALEIIRDTAFVPAFDSSLYRAYRNSRIKDLARGDDSEESRTTAFEAATTEWLSGYPAVKKQMYDRMVKSRGYNEDLVGERLERALWKRIDDFWIARFEAKLQQERMKERKAEVMRQIWATEARKLDAIRRASLRTPSEPPPQPVERSRPDRRPTPAPEVAAIQVELIDASSGRQVQGDVTLRMESGRTTRASGSRVLFSDMPAGRAEVEASASGYMPAYQSVALVPSGPPARLRLRLTPLRPVEIQRPPTRQPENEPPPLPPRTEKSRPPAQESYDDEAALRAWTADFEAKANHSGHDSGCAWSYRLEWVERPTIRGGEVVGAFNKYVSKRCDDGRVVAPYVEVSVGDAGSPVRLASLGELCRQYPQYRRTR